MATIFFPGELVYVTDGTYLEYANVSSVDAKNAPIIVYKNNTNITGSNQIYHLPINRLTLEDTGHYYIQNALIGTYTGPCYYLSFPNSKKVKVIIDGGKFKLVKESKPGIVDLIEPVETIGDIQQLIKMWYGIDYAIDANKILSIWPHSREEIITIDRCLDDILSDDPTIRLKGYDDLAAFYPKSRFNKETCLFWLTEYNINEFIVTKSLNYQKEADKYFALLKGSEYYKILERKMLEFGLI